MATKAEKAQEKEVIQVFYRTMAINAIDVISPISMYVSLGFDSALLSE